MKKGNQNFELINDAGTLNCSSWEGFQRIREKSGTELPHFSHIDHRMLEEALKTLTFRTFKELKKDHRLVFETIQPNLPKEDQQELLKRGFWKEGILVEEDLESLVQAMHFGEVRTKIESTTVYCFESAKLNLIAKDLSKKVNAMVYHGLNCMRMEYHTTNFSRLKVFGNDKVAEIIEKHPIIMSVMPPEDRNYRLCRLAARQFNTTEHPLYWLSAYHVLDYLVEKRIIELSRKNE